MATTNNASGKNTFTNLNKEEAMKQYIIDGCNAVAGDLVPCVKQPVYALIITTDGKEHFGSNWMTNSNVTVCPRVELNCPSGQGYELCKEVCNQDFHAERFAISLCTSDTTDATLYLTGHTYCCDDCIAAMKAAGIKTAVVLDSGKVYNF